MYRIICIVLSLLLVSGCGNHGTGHVIYDETIKIGLIAPLSGPFAVWGQSILHGVELALEDVGVHVDLIVEDSECNPKKTVSIARELLTVRDVDVLFGPGCVTGLKAIASIVDEHNVLMFSTGLLDLETFEISDDVINIAGQIGTEARYATKFVDKQEWNSVAIVHGSTAFGHEYANRAEEYLEYQSIEVISRYPTRLDEKDFRSVIAQIVDEQPDVILLHQGEAGTGIFVSQLREYDQEIEVISVYGLESQSALQAGGKSLDGVYYTYPYNSAEESEQKVKFEERYDLEFDGHIPTATSYFVYDGLMIFSSAVSACGGYQKECVQDYFFDLSSYSGISGEMQFGKDGSINRPFGVKQVINGEFVWIKKELH